VCCAYAYVLNLELSGRLNLGRGGHWTRERFTRVRVLVSPAASSEALRVGVVCIDSYSYGTSSRKDIRSVVTVLWRTNEPRPRGTTRRADQGLCGAPAPPSYFFFQSSVALVYTPTPTSPPINYDGGLLALHLHSSLVGVSGCTAGNNPILRALALDEH